MTELATVRHPLEMAADYATMEVPIASARDTAEEAAAWRAVSASESSLALDDEDGPLGGAGDRRTLIAQ